MMTTRLMRCWLATAATLTVTAALLAPPAAAGPGPGLSTDDPPTHDTSGATGDTGNTGDGSGDPIDVGDLVDPDPAEPGPVGHTGAATYAMVSTQGAVAPHSLASVDGTEGVDTVTATLDDGAFLAVIIIDDADDATEFRFQGAVPDGHTAVVQQDGSVAIFDAEGNPAGGWEKPWAVDAAGKPVSTSFTIEGETLVQTVNHIGHAYPVVADPCGGWSRLLRCAVAATLVVVAVSQCGSGNAVGCAGAVAGAVEVISNIVEDSIEDSQQKKPEPPRPQPRPRPKPRCSRPGCR